jgi:hypothetical protein
MFATAVRLTTRTEFAPDSSGFIVTGRCGTTVPRAIGVVFAWHNHTSGEMAAAANRLEADGHVSPDIKRWRSS